MSNPTVPAAAEGMLEFSPIIQAVSEFRRLSQADSAFSLKVVEMLHAGEDPTKLVIARLGAEAAGPVLDMMVPASGGTSERVNALFARYVAIEKEQHHAPRDDQHADDIGAVALALRARVLRYATAPGMPI